MADSKIVPREPTAEMIDAGPDDLTSDEKRRAWQAMYDIAPAQAEPRKCIACPDPTPGRCDACPEDDPDRAAEVASIIADAIVATTPAAPSPELNSFRNTIAALRARAERYDWLRELTLDEWRELLKDVECREEDEIYPDASAGYTPTARRHWSVYFDAAADAAIDRARTQEPK